MRKKLFSTCIFFILVGVVNAQNRREGMYMPTFALKTNGLYWATTTPNLGVEFALSKKTTIELTGSYNPWDFSNNKKLKFWLVQPEFRYWLCERFNGHFLGLHGHYAEYNVGGIKQLELKGKRYQGNLYGGGISYGYHWILGKRWSLEATLGVGYARLKYDKYVCGTCGPKEKGSTKNYWGPTKAGINLIYILK